ncbi:MAG: hypothetical protein LBU65_02280 [Planctomycetaceae bacterium]|nr:hypothetical protein [Planctomycetaceae bacterium]
MGNYGVKGQEYQPKGCPVETKTHDFPDKELGKAIPYVIYDLLDNNGFVNVGVDHDTLRTVGIQRANFWIGMRNLTNNYVSACLLERGKIGRYCARTLKKSLNSSGLGENG